MSKIYKDCEDCAVWDEYDPRWNTIDGRSKKKAYAFWESDLIYKALTKTVKVKVTVK